MTPDLKMAARFLATLDPDGIFTFQTFGDKTKDPKLNRVLHGSFEEHANELARLNAQGAGVFTMVNKGDGVVHEGARTCRTMASVIAVRSLFVDLDGSPLEPAIKVDMSDILVESSPQRWHLYWLVKDCPLGDFEGRQKQLAEMFNGDRKVSDLPRVMRLPGFVHQKGEPFVTRLVWPE